MTDLDLTHRVDGDVDVITVTGDLDVYTAPRLRELGIELTYHSDRRRLIVIDLDGCPWLDSTGLGVILGIKKRARAKDGDVVLACSMDRILRVFRMTGLSKVFAIHDTVDQAVAAITKGA